MNVSQRGLDLIKQFEGCKLELYNCPAGHATIGWGHLVHPGAIDGRSQEDPYKNGITQEQADALLKSDVANKAEHYLDLYVRVPINQNQYDALCSFTYNVGNGNFCSSTLLRLLNMGKMEEAAEEFPKWNKAGGEILRGLKKRREAEQALFEEKA